MANKQKQMLNNIAKRHGLSISQAEEIWTLLIDKIASTISDLDKKNDDGTYDLDKFKTINVQNFGKFIPHKRHILNANKWILKKKEDEI
jgi:nucleoid DNA-binding protein